MTPAVLTKAEHAATVRSIACSVEEGDSFEGSFEYHLEKPDTFSVTGAWRVGNTEGQGGMHMLGTPEESAEEVSAHG